MFAYDVVCCATFYVPMCVRMLRANSLSHEVYFLLCQKINDTFYSTEGLHGLGIVILLYYVMTYGQTGADRKHKSQITFAHLHIFLCFGGEHV